MTRHTLMVCAAAGSFVLLAAAFAFQAMGWAPCAMCLWQRWPHAAALSFGVVGLFFPIAAVAWLGAVSALTTAGLGLYHSGVELKWWEGPASCTSSGGSELSSLSGADLLPGASDIAPLVLCDTLTPFFMGLTMANWNALLSFGLGCIWVFAALRVRA